MKQLKQQNYNRNHQSTYRLSTSTRIQMPPPQSMNLNLTLAEATKPSSFRSSSNAMLFRKSAAHSGTRSPPKTALYSQQSKMMIPQSLIDCTISKRNHNQQSNLLHNMVLISPKQPHNQAYTSFANLKNMEQHKKRKLQMSTNRRLRAAILTSSQQNQK